MGGGVKAGTLIKKNFFGALKNFNEIVRALVVGSLRRELFRLPFTIMVYLSIYFKVKLEYR